MGILEWPGTLVLGGLIWVPRYLGIGSFLPWYWYWYCDWYPGIGFRWLPGTLVLGCFGCPGTWELGFLEWPGTLVLACFECPGSLVPWYGATLGAQVPGNWEF